jgi:hypothetical protein
MYLLNTNMTAKAASYMAITITNGLSQHSNYQGDARGGVLAHIEVE